MKLKHYRTTEDYFVKNYRGWSFTVPKGAMASNKTANGPSEGYRFWMNFHGVIEDETGCPNSTLAHDLTYYGLNLPEEICEEIE